MHSRATAMPQVAADQESSKRSEQQAAGDASTDDTDEVVYANNNADAWKSHHFVKSGRTSCSGKFMKRVHYEWELLQELPKGEIAVCVCEERADLMIAAIKGPQDTPYADGLFFFDILLPSKYPDEPPKVHFHAHGERINPNLYQCGKVCLSLLGTWPGQHSVESWDPKNSSVFQGLILVREPWYNEPGFEQMRGIKAYEEESVRYTNMVYLLTLKSIIRSTEAPPLQFASLCAQHFRSCRERILRTCITNRDSAIAKGKSSKSSRAMVWSGGVGLTPAELVKSLEQTIPRLEAALGLTAPASARPKDEYTVCGRKRKRGEVDEALTSPSAATSKATSAAVKQAVAKASKSKTVKQPPQSPKAKPAALKKAAVSVAKLSKASKKSSAVAQKARTGKGKA